MINMIKKILKKKEEPKKVKEKILILTEDKTFENEVAKSPDKQTKETKSTLTFGV